MREQEKNKIQSEDKKSQQPPKVPEKYRKEHIVTAPTHYETHKEKEEKHHKREESSIFSKLKIKRRNFYLIGMLILLLLVGLFYATTAKTIIHETYFFLNQS